MAFYRLFERSDSRGVISVERGVKRFDYSVIAAAVSAVRVAAERLYINRALRRAERFNGYVSAFFVENELAERTAKSYVASAVGGKSGHQQRRFYAFFKYKVGQLVIYYIVVARKHASAVRSFAQRFYQRGLGQRAGVCDNALRPFMVGTALVLPIVYIEFDRAVCATIYMRTVTAPRRRAVGRVVRIEIRKVADGRNAVALRLRVILQQINVVTALCEYHGRGFFAVAPVAAHKAVRLMPVRNLFNRLNSYKPAQLARTQDFSALQKSRGVA